MILILNIYLFLATLYSLWNLIPQPGIEPGPAAVRVWSPNHWTAREFHLLIIDREIIGCNY